MFIVFAGIDGSGKTTQSLRLTESLALLGVDVVHTKAPGGTEFGTVIRKIVLDEPVYRSVETETFLFMADRAEHVETVLRPALERGAIVVCDRFVESTLAYQAPGLRGDGARKILAIHDIMEWPVPDIVIHMRLTADVAAARCAARKGAERDPDRERLADLASRYDAIIGAAGGTVHAIDAAGEPDECAKAILCIVASAMAARSPVHSDAA